MRSPDTSLTSIAFADFFPSVRFLTTIISDVTEVPKNVLLFRRNAPIKSALPSLTTQLRICCELSSVPFDDMNIPIPPSRNLRIFFAIQKLCISWNFFDKSLSEVVSHTLKPVTKGTFVIVKSMLPLGIEVPSNPCISTFASGYSKDKILPAVGSFSTA